MEFKESYSWKCPGCGDWFTDGELECGNCNYTLQDRLAAKDKLIAQMSEINHKHEERIEDLERELDELKHAFKEAVKFAVRLRGSLPK